MSLDDTVKRIIADKRGSVLVVDDACDIDSKHDETYHEHIVNEESCEIWARKNDISFEVFDLGRNKVLTEMEHRIRHFDTYLVRYDALRMDINEISILAGKILSANPDAEIIHCIPENPTMAATLRRMLPLIGIPGSVEEVDYDSFPTLMHLLCYQMTGEVWYPCWSGHRAHRTPRSRDGANSLSAKAHDYKNRMWKDHYVQFIDSSLRAGNSQTSMNYNFLILSDREVYLLHDYRQPNEEKVNVQPSDYQLKEEDLEDCAAIFIDNQWNGKETALGEGINTLKRVHEQLNGRKVPIIYISGHDLVMFTEEEKKQLSDMGATLASKSSFPKVCKDKEKAQKEVEISNLLSLDPVLGKYSARTTVNVGDEFQVVCSEIVQNQEEDVERKELFESLELEDHPYMHRMYVLAHFHEKMKPYKDQFTTRTRELKSFDSLRSRWAPEEYRELYEAIRQNEALSEVRTLCHNDAKWDNWFGTEQLVLGDFGDVGGNSEYKDLARAMFDSFGVYGTGFVDFMLEGYRKIRQSINSQYEDSDLIDNTQQMIFVECLREGTIRRGEKGEHLMGMAKRYASLLTDKVLSGANETHK